MYSATYLQQMKLCSKHIKNVEFTNMTQQRMNFTSMGKYYREKHVDLR